jgi:hypothetical protein
VLLKDGLVGERRIGGDGSRRALFGRMPRSVGVHGELARESVAVAFGERVVALNLDGISAGRLDPKLVVTSEVNSCLAGGLGDFRG